MVLIQTLHELSVDTASRRFQPKKLICRLKCNDGYKPRKKSAMCVNGDWLEKPTVCEKDPDYVEWDPSLSTCKLPKKANKENQSGAGKWHCKAQLINPNEPSVEAENALAAEEGYELITEKSTIAGLVSEDFMRRWKSTKGKEPYVICKLKCHDGYELEGAKLAKCEMESGSWTQQASGECHPIPWTPEESECELPKKVNKKLQNGHWSCKTKLSNDYRGESDYDTEGQVIITDSTEWADLLDDNESGEWRKEKNKDKEMVMCCTLNCDAGYKPNGSNTANCAMKSNTWYGNFDSICVADWQPKCSVPAPIYGGAWSCNTMLVDPTQRKPDLPKMIKIEDGMSTQDLINRNPGQAERWGQQPTLEWMLVCQLACNYGYNTVKCNLDTGVWNAAMPTCEAERLVVQIPSSSTNMDEPAKEVSAKPTKKPKKTKQKKTKTPKNPDLKKKKKLAKACKKGNENACKKLEVLKKQIKENRSDDFDFLLPDFTEQCGPRGNSRCESSAPFTQLTSSVNNYVLFFTNRTNSDHRPE